MRFFKTMIVGVFCAAAALCLTAAPAEARVEARSTTIRIDRDAVARGEVSAVQAAHNAMVRAARQVCMDPGIRSVAMRRLERICVAETLEDTIAAVNLPTLTRYFAAMDERDRVRVQRREPNASLLAAIRGDEPTVMFAGAEEPATAPETHTGAL